MITGDLHRFGRRVSFHQSDPVIYKPRSVSIEHLLLDPRSSLLNFKNQLGLGFSQVVNETGVWKGECENILPFKILDSEFNSNKEIIAAISGHFLATATLLGLNDLHHENILYIKKNGQMSISPVDLEIIFYKFVTAAETCLIPSAKAPKAKCGFFQLMNILDVSLIPIFTDAFIEAWTHLAQISERIVEIIAARLKGKPIRFLARPTLVYSQILLDRKNAQTNLSPPIHSEESIQIDQGDIPYFFSYFESPEKPEYFYSKDKTKHAPSINMHSFYSRHLSAEILKGPFEATDKLYFNSLSHILSILPAVLGIEYFKFKGKNFSANKKDTNIRIETQKGIINVKDKV